MQAQEYPAARWALALRMREQATDTAISRAVDEGRIIRTHVLRPTWHFVAASDIGWLLELTAPHVQRALTSVYRRLELDAAACRRAAAIFERALRDAPALTRHELGSALGRKGVQATGVRLALLTAFAELEGVLCSGPSREKHSTYALLATRVRRARRLSCDEALAELTRRYVTSHGPATIRDFVWWSGLPARDAKRGIEMIRARANEIDGATYWTVSDPPPIAARRKTVHLLPIYDEYLVAYRDREAVPLVVGARARGPFPQPLIIAGQVAGTWKPTRVDDGVVVVVNARRSLTASERTALAKTAARYGHFLDRPVAVSVTGSC